MLDTGRKNNLILNWMVFVFFVLTPLFIFIRYPLKGLLIVDASDGITLVANTKYYINSITNGGFSIWNKYLGAGTPSITAANLYPLNLISGFLPPEWFILIYYSFHVGTGAFFFHLYLREIKCSTLSSIIVAYIYQFSIHLGGLRKSHMVIIIAIVMLPIALYLIQKHLNSGKLCYLILSTVPLVLGFYGGHPQTAFYIAASATIYYLVMALYKKTKPITVLKNITLFFLTALGFGAVYLLPTIELMITYAQYGSSKTNFATFASYSIHPLKLIQMIFPRFFGDNIFMYGSTSMSSEMDIEIYVGVVLLVVTFFSIKKFWRNIYVKLSLSFVLIAFCYAAIAHIPILRSIVYHTPILGTFRVPSRSIPVCIFFLYIILAIGLSQFSKNGFLSDITKFVHTVVFYCFILCAIMSASLMTMARIFDSGGFTLQIEIMNWLKASIIPSIAFLFVFATVLFFDRNCRRYQYHFFLLSFLVITLIETMPFFIMAQPASVSSFGSEDLLSQTILKDNKDYKVFDAMPKIYTWHQSIVSQNKSMVYRIPSINAYIAYNNPILYRMLSGEHEAALNFSGLLTGSIHAQKNIHLQNDLLSMLGVKYIIDNWNFIPDEGLAILSEGDPLYELTSEIILPASTGGVTVWTEQINIEPYRYYNIRINYKSDASSGYAYIDFYSDEKYDLPECQEIFDISQTQTNLLLFSSDTSLASKDIYLRIISVDMDQPLNVYGLVLAEAVEGDEILYIPYYSDNGNRVFENTNVCDILYFSKEIKGIDDIETIIANPIGLRLDEISYVVGIEDKSFNLSGSSIEDIDFRNNKITATVHCDQDEYINFSQCYFPGWRAYVDGKRTDLHVVNALIMGTEVSAGTHTVEFKYISISFICGLIITCVTILYWASYFLMKKQKGIPN